MEIIYADTFFKRFKGLMGKKNFDYIMVFTNLTDSSIHTMFMRFEIDIYFVDKNGVIFDKVTLRPWKFYKPKKQAKYIIETEKNKLNLKIGDRLDFV
ncbi:MAG: DUF192 domain-containing protein [Methanobrevibacter sp.]|jgi:uncharacterized membrane protein (UPF0127 family)|uniref:DUF192 domain-containing protein n=1 Tax=Methanobrevibacter sp. UBA212 TaxID=1915476 RepID=UPI0025F6C49A|nr:DUF192 domain-containing protein [Methanobrevibacter sp. UBA212]MBR3155782.1 DUF192 domain-containing protein [Methanobrevibacter sp.]MEE1150379.1 DUF192 domain-containing protein [Methanobrevibacter sp.]